MIVKEEFLSKLRRYFGLNLYEVKIWTALLSRGVSTAGELSDIANVPRSRSYDILESLEKKGFVNSEWNMNSERPRKIYSLTTKGQNMLNFTEESLNLICRKLSAQTKTEMTTESSSQPTIGLIAKRDKNTPTSRLAFEMRQSTITAAK